MNEIDGNPSAVVPQTDDERRSASWAVAEERRKSEGDALVNALTKRERLLLAYAWEDGEAETRKALLRRLENPHAVTLDAAAVRTAISDWRARTTDSLFFGKPYPAPHHDERLVSIVRLVDRVLRYEDKS